MSSKDVTIKGSVTVEFRPWTAPNFAVPKQNPGDAFPDGVPVSVLTDACLAELVNHWIEDVYRNAGRKPAIRITGRP